MVEKHSVQTASGRISYTEQGSGPVALFVHGVLLNSYLWRHQLAGCATSGAISRSICWRMETRKSRRIKTYR
jgi:pimeloyl-ACP methyl ester carboxylesterase